ncbi:MAG: hypothetical protein IT490_03585 [Candidatus Contendobacter sp.]|nr:hypothetical protein [Candidatus Contendobacter sp.]
MTTTRVVVPDACLAWLESFYALPLAERRWVIDFITDQSPDDIGADVAARLRELYDLPKVCAVALVDPTPRERAMAATFGVGGAT